MLCLSMNLSFSSLSQYYTVASGSLSVSEACWHEYLCTDGSASTGLVVQNQKSLFLFARVVGTREYTRDVAARAKKRGVSREVDVRVDVYEQLPCGHFAEM